MSYGQTHLVSTVIMKGYLKVFKQTCIMNLQKEMYCPEQLDSGVCLATLLDHGVCFQ